MMSNPVDVTQKYFDAWNAHDAVAIVNTFVINGIYQDPNITARGDEIGAYAQSLWEAFPDLTLEIVSKAETATGMVVVEWLLTGTNSKSFQGLLPSGNKISLAGADFIKILDDKIQSVMGYFDTKVIEISLGYR